MFENTTPLFFVVLFGGILLMLFAPRRWILGVFLSICVFVSFGPRVVLFGQNFMIHRVLLAFVWLRVLMRGEYRGFVWRPLDKVLVLFCLWTLIGDTLLWGTVHAMVYQIANQIYDALGIYFMARIFLEDASDLRRLVGCLAGICIVLAGFMCLELVTGRSWLDALGAFQEFVQVRRGRFRCQAAFGVPITAGTFGAVLLPLFVACWWQDRKMKRWAVPGCIGATLITLTSASGGPCMTYAAALAGLAGWRLRGRMRAFWVCVCIGILALAVVMKAPVWFLIARLHVVPGNSAYHRAKVIDEFVQHFGEWWSLGMKTTDQWGWEMMDVTNQYLVAAKHGGLLAFLLFLGVLRAGFREVGRCRAIVAGNFSTEFLIWSFGVMLFAHTVSFIGISYFDQIKVLWYVCVAAIASLPLLIVEQEESLKVATLEDIDTVAVPANAETPSS